jgi:serine protease Do
MIVFSTVTSAYLLKDNLSTENTISQITQTDSVSTEDSVAQISSSSEELTVSEINNLVSPAVVLITGTNMYGTGQGTGMIISEDGYILTNAHVVADYSQLTVTLNDDNETEYQARMVGYDDATDIAVIKIDATGLPTVTFGTSSDLEVGASVVVIGNPLGEEFSGSVTTGIISALDREVAFDDGQVYTYIQTDAAINSGNSGGPLVNMSGQVIGINSAKIDTSIAEGMGFAIPIDTAISVINDLIDYGYVTNRPYIGIGGETINQQYSQYYNIPEGVHIASIASGSPAADSDLQVDDIITAINGAEITSIGELNNIKNQYSVGDTVELTVYRYTTKKTFIVEITLGEMTSDMQ